MPPLRLTCILCLSSNEAVVALGPSHALCRTCARRLGELAGSRPADLDGLWVVPPPSPIIEEQLGPKAIAAGRQFLSSLPPSLSLQPITTQARVDVGVTFFEMGMLADALRAIAEAIVHAAGDERELRELVPLFAPPAFPNASRELLRLRLYPV